MPETEFRIDYDLKGHVILYAKNKKAAEKLFDSWIERGVGAASEHLDNQRTAKAVK